MTDHTDTTEPNSVEPTKTESANAANGKPPNVIPGERDCYIYLPGMGSNASVDQSVLGVASQIARVMDLNSKDDSVDFFAKVEAAKNQGDTVGERGTIYRKDSNGTRAVLDLYRYDYRGNLVDRFAQRNLFMRTLLLILALPVSTVRVFGAFITGRSSKTRSEMIQLLYALGILATLILYLGILLLAVLGVVAQLNGMPTALGLWKDTVQNWLTASQAIVVASAVLGFFLPAGTNLKDIIGKAAVNYLCLIYYLQYGDGRAAVQGEFDVMIDNILRKSAVAKRDKKEGSYKTINLIAYSFGSIVALDSLFPIDRDPSVPLQRISTLVTIGCPFDFIRSLWQDYFDARRKFELGRPVRWLNVYSLEDVLGSNFRNDPSAGDANVTVQGTPQDEAVAIPIPSVNVHYTQGLNYSKLSWFSSLTLLGLRSHAMYWGASQTPETNCFNSLVPRIFEGDPVLD